jgi:hypothetical protein
MLQVHITLRGNIAGLTAASQRALDEAATSVIRRKTRGIQRALRTQIKRAGLGNLGNALRMEFEPRSGSSVNARGRVFSKALVKRAGGTTDLITLFDEGATIRPRQGRFLAIPTAAAAALKGRRRRGQLTPRMFGPGALVFRAGGDRRTGVLALKADPRVIVFVLVRTVRLRKRLAIQQAVERQLANTDALLAREFDRRMARLVQRFSTQQQRLVQRTLASGGR